jgi:hypothetical protein
MQLCEIFSLFHTVWKSVASLGNTGLGNKLLYMIDQEMLDIKTLYCSGSSCVAHYTLQSINNNIGYR